MSASRRRNVSGSERAEPTREDLEPVDELPTLDPIDEDELETLEPLDEDDDSPVSVTTGPADEDGFDVCVAIDVPEMPKADVADAVEGPLQRAIASASADLRWRRVIVRFGGEGLIGSAVKGMVGEAVRSAKPLKVVVRRGFGDEVVHEGSLPAVRTTVTPELEVGHLRVRVDTGDIESVDLATALRAPLDDLVGRVSDATVAFRFTGSARPDAATRDAISEAMAGGGATRVSIDSDAGEEVLFDRALEARVAVRRAGAETELVIDLAEDPSVTAQALALVLPRDPEGISDKRVRVRFEGRTPDPGELVTLVEVCAALGPERLEWVRGDAEADVLWPRLIHDSAHGDSVLLQVRSGGRRRAGVVASFRREAAALSSAIAGRKVTVDWPVDFAFDAEIERTCLDAAIGAHGPASVACTFGGEEREPFVPPPVTVRRADDPGGPFCAVRLDTDTGKPVELARAIERRVRQRAGEFKDQRVRVEVTGSGTVSRTMLRTLREEIEKAGAVRLEIDDHGTVDVLLPRMLTIESDGARAFRIAAEPAGRDAAQVETALQRELDAFELPTEAAFRVGTSPVAGAVIEALVTSRGAAQVILDGDPPVQVHPRLFEVPDRSPGSLTIRANPGGDDAMVAAQVERELPAILEGGGDLGGVDVRIAWPGASEPFSAPLANALDLVLGAGPKKLSLDAGDGKARQLFPEIVPDYVTVLGQKDDATPPMVMLGIDHGQGSEHTAKVMAKLEAHAEDIEGRRVLLALRHDDRDVAVKDDDALIGAVRTLVDAKAAATLVFRGRDRARRPFFEVVYSKIDGLAVGAKFADPRQRS